VKKKDRRNLTKRGGESAQQRSNRMIASDCKSDLLYRIECEIVFRDEKAAEHPEDSRNAQSAAALRALHGRIATVPDDAPKLVTLAKLWDAATESESFDACLESEQELLRLYAFDVQPGGPELDGDPDNFLAGLIWELETELGRHGGPMSRFRHALAPREAQ
jgi:hypothetical protein